MTAAGYFLGRLPALLGAPAAGLLRLLFSAVFLETGLRAFVAAAFLTFLRAAFFATGFLLRA